MGVQASKQHIKVKALDQQRGKKELDRWTQCMRGVHSDVYG
jgi:hypothetical protein